MQPEDDWAEGSICCTAVWSTIVAPMKVEERIEGLKELMYVGHALSGGGGGL
jgi:hypothetical protein